MSDNSPQSSYQEWIGRVIDERYRIVELLGEGGMGAVFVAEHLSLQKQVAFKVVRSELAGNDELAARFAREAMVTSRIDHINVISAIDYGTLQEGGAYLVMQLVRGSSLKAILTAEGSLHWSRAADIGAQIADALSAAQGHGIVHRDLKPDNILIQKREDGGDLVKILDFGIAKFTRDSLAPPPLRSAQKLTKVGIIIGTPGYMAPEQAVGEKADHRADLYSLAVILWESIAGRRLWEAEEITELVQKQLKHKPALLREATGDLTIPEVLQNLTARMLANEPFQRPENAGEIRDILREIALAGKAEISAERTGIEKLTAQQEPVPESLLEPLPPPVAPASPEAETIEAVPESLGLRTAGQAPATPLTGERQGPRTRISRRTTALFGSMALVVLAAGAILVLAGQLEVKPKGELKTIAKTVVPLDPDREKEREKQDAQTVSAGSSEIAGAIRPQLEILVHGETRTERVEAAEALLRHVPPDEVPAYVRSIAYLQIAKTCKQKRDELIKIEQAGDPKVLPVLLILSDRPKTGCGPRGDKDCLACLRKRLEAIIVKLENKPLQPEAD